MSDCAISSSSSSSSIGSSARNGIDHGNGENSVVRGQRETPLELVIATAAARLPCLRELIVRYDSGAVGTAELDELRRLPQLEVLEVERWSNEDRCPCCLNFLNDTNLDAPDFADGDLERLLVSLPRLKRLALSLRSKMTPDAHKFVRRLRPQLMHVYLAVD